MVARDRRLLDPRILSHLNEENLIVQAVPKQMTNMLVVLVVIVIIVHRTVHDVSVLENISK